MTHDLLKYYNRLSVLVRKNLKVLNEQQDHDALHQIRVSIKRIRALLLFAEWLTTGKVKARKIYQPLKMLFKSAGFQRDEEVHLRLIADYEKKSRIKAVKYKEFYKKHLSEKKQDLNLQLNDFSEHVVLPDIKRVLEKTIVQFSEKKLNKKIFTFSIRHLKKATRLMDEGKRGYHTARIQMKRAFYLLEVIQQENKYSAKIILEQIKPLEDTLGKWHDLVIARENLSKFNAGTSEEKKDFNTFNEKINVEITKLEHKLSSNKTLKNLIKETEK